MKNGDSLTVIILTFNEEIHIERCIRSVQPVVSRIFIVDSFSTDRTVEIAESLGAIVVKRKWKNYADQFQWGLDNYSDYCGGATDWIMRVDADEYLESGLKDELHTVLQHGRDDVTGFYIRLKVVFYGKWIRFGGFYPLILLRIWRHGAGFVEQRWMDEHIVLPEDARIDMLNGHLIDENLKGITFWVTKHNTYASREAVDLLNNKYHFLEKDESLKALDDSQAKWKRTLKDSLYSRLPISVRATLYFFYRYFIRLGFMDGFKGFIWHFMQGWWYRMLADVKVMEIEKRSNGDVKKLREILRNDHGLDL